MRAFACWVPWLAVMLLAERSAGASIDADPAAAERQYRVAQRLGADRSPEAAAAFAKVVALAPDGPLADDALVDLACLSDLPDWPEEVGALDARRATVARAPLEKTLTAYPESDRATEARYRLALLRLAPNPGRDAVRARQDLVALAANPSRDRWVVAARYALGVLDEQSGETERAGAAFARILVERPDSDVAPRARAGFGRTLLAEARFGEAAGWFQHAIESGAPPAVGAAALRDLALRELFRERQPALKWTEISSPLPTIATTKGASLLATAADGRIVVFDRKGGALRSFDAKGIGSMEQPVGDATALATDPYGRLFVATKDEILRWDDAGLTTVASLGRSGSPSSMAVDASGAVFISDKRGDRIERWDPGATTPVIVRESKGGGIAALAIASGRVLAAEEKTGQLVVVAGPGSGRSFGPQTLRRPVALAVDAAGRIVVLDGKSETLTRLSPAGDVIDTLSLPAGGVSKPLAVATTPDGAVRILDGASGAVAEAR